MRAMRSLLPPIAVALVATATGTGGAAMNVTATDVQRQVVYHSPQTPGYTCWVSAWLTADGGLRLAFHQATGPLSGRPQARKEVREALAWPPPGLSVGYDMTGTIQQVITLDSRDGGTTWTPVGAEPFHTPMNGFVSGYCALQDGTVMRATWGMYLPFYDVPQTGHLQRSTDGGLTWGPPILLADPAKGIPLPKVVRQLRDGRVAAIGGYIPLTEGVTGFRQGLAHIETALWWSRDSGATWSEPQVVLSKADGVSPTEESDLAELADGRLLVINRTNVPNRWQVVLAPQGDGYEVVSRGPAPFPHSGQPDLLCTRDGVALHIATSNVSASTDGGQTWQDLGFGTPYYPSSVELPDGRIFTVGHRGSDDPYDGSVDQQIESLTFRVRAE